MFPACATACLIIIGVATFLCGGAVVYFIYVGVSVPPPFLVPGWLFRSAFATFHVSFCGPDARRCLNCWFQLSGGGLLLISPPLILARLDAGICSVCHRALHAPARLSQPSQLRQKRNHVTPTRDAGGVRWEVASRGQHSPMNASVPPNPSSVRWLLATSCRCHRALGVLPPLSATFQRYILGTT